MQYSNMNIPVSDVKVENQKSSVESLFEKIRNYLETRIELLKLKAIDKSSSVISVLITFVIVFLIFGCFFLFLNIGIALLIGELIGKTYYGFFILAAFYVITGIVLLKFRNKWIRTPLINMMVKGLNE